MKPFAHGGSVKRPGRGGSSSGELQPPRRGHSCRFLFARAFTLIELLTVIGLIVVLVGSLAAALRDRGKAGATLQSAQSEVAALLNATRTQASLHRAPACLLIYADGPPHGEAKKYLRCLQVAREEPPESGQWVAVGASVFLPGAIFIVPSSVPATHRAPGVEWPETSDRVSTLSGPTDFTLNGVPFGAAYYIEFSLDGRTPANGFRIALSTAKQSSDLLPQFDNPAAVRGIVVRSSGAVTLVNDATGF